MKNIDDHRFIHAILIASCWFRFDLSNEKIELSTDTFDLDGLFVSSIQKKNWRLPSGILSSIARCVSGHRDRYKWQRSVAVGEYVERLLDLSDY